MKYLSSHIGRLRLFGFLEGVSLLLLVFIAVPLKHIWEMPLLVELVGPVHGALFLLFIVNALRVAFQYKWKFMKTTWKVLLSCMVPFGTFYIDAKILRPIHEAAVA